MVPRQPSTLPTPWSRTPCLESAGLSRAAGCRVFLKYENLQPSGSFKSRGVGNLMLQAIERHCSSEASRQKIRFYCSSGGNAGLACVNAAITLGAPATIVVPMSTSEMMIGKLKTLGADVHQVGMTWFEADSWMREELLGKDNEGIYVPPFDHEDVWNGNATMIEEVVEQVGVPDVIICSVGGGGLFNGVVQEALNHNISIRNLHPLVVAMETIGAHSLHESIQKNEHIRLPGISSIALSLGATKVSKRTYEYAQMEDVVLSVAVSDADAIKACVKFADEEHILVEPACGVNMALAYDGTLREALEGKRIYTDEEWMKLKVVIIVCGGSNISLDILETYRKKFT